MEQIDARDGAETAGDASRDAPWALEHIQIKGIWHHPLQSGMADPGVDAGSVVGIWITGLPQQVGEALLKGDGMFTTAARYLERRPTCRQHRFEQISDRFSVALCGGEEQALVH